MRAEFLRDRLVPKAVLFFTGEALEEEEEEEVTRTGCSLIPLYQDCVVALMVVFDPTKIVVWLLSWCLIPPRL